MDTEVTDHMELLGSSPELRLVRRWLEEAWRHGEMVADHDGLLPEDMQEPPPAVPFRPSHARASEDWLASH